jgi:cytochrome c-type biogenesis protein CcmH
MRRLILPVVLLAAGVALAVAAVRGPAPPRTMTERVRAVASSLRCPICQNLSVADSPSGLAAEMRRTIAAELASGMTPDQIRRRFVASYGEWILEAPPKRGLDLLAWVGPALLVLGGLVAGALAIRRGTTERGTVPVGHSELAPEDRALLDRELATAPAEDDDR